MRLPAAEAASRFIETYFPGCEAAILAGSSVQGGATETSDLDLVLFDETGPGPYRKTFVAFGWVVEAFVLTRAAYRYFFDEGVNCAIPSLQRMCAEGSALRGSQAISAIVAEAKADLLAGPPAWTAQELDKARYEIGESMQDFSGCPVREECLFILGKLAEQLAEFVLRTGGQWLGHGKWLWRCLRRHDADFSEALTNALEAYYRHDTKVPVLTLVQQLLEPYGGLLTEGYSEGLYDEEKDGTEQEPPSEQYNALIRLLGKQADRPD